ncbi:MAG: ABC transporter permease [Gemmatimonadota bacterium]|nr:ABC transporter permease [Gemmatimonadota bacterium]MDE3127658.1 ABC transporter permease [Gemmatimonadota bacterium]MDE3171514.1 ABC transporter permease [Gemmatimonadota bacterium]MDE3217210.1 ABC transporter permease [Gemmatimonadota bacterium]
MGKTFVVFKREYLERVRSRWFLVATFLGPVFMAAIIVLPTLLAARTKSSSNVANVIVLDATGTDLGARVAKALAALSPTSPPPRVSAVAPDQLPAAEDRATHTVMQRGAEGYLVLDSTTLSGKGAEYAGRNATSLVDISSLTATVRKSVLDMRLENAGMNPDTVAALTGVKLDLKTDKITDKGRQAGGGMSSVVFGYIIAFLLYTMIALYGQNMLRGVLEEKTTRVAEVVVSSVKPDQLLAGKIFGIGAVALTQVFVWVVCAAALFAFGVQAANAFGGPQVAAAGIHMPTVSPLVGVALLLFFVLGFMLYTSLFAAVGAMVSNQEDVQQAQWPVMMPLIAAIIFLAPVIANPASTMSKVVSWIPFTSPIIMPLRMSLITVPWPELAATLAGLALACWGAIWVSARIYRVGLLMYGKRPSLDELLKWIRMA